MSTEPMEDEEIEAWRTAARESRLGINTWKGLTTDDFSAGVDDVEQFVATIDALRADPYEGWREDLRRLAQEVASNRGKRFPEHLTGLAIAQAERLSEAFGDPTGEMDGGPR